MKQSIKSLLGGLLFTSGLDEVLLHRTAVIVAFHRIQDAPASDGLSVGTEMFARLCRFFSQRFHVVSLRDLVERLEHGCDVGHHLAITFDDGYRDNFVNARPVLEQLSLPATFFAVSDWVGTAVVPWWDREAGVRHAFMSWDEIRILRDGGFDIGAHTRTHVDLGRVSGETAWEEIAGARLELERRLGCSIDLFAYPYGRRHNLASANRQLVKAAGFRCCCSCYGGTAAAGTDPFDLPRVAISPWYASPYQLGFELACGRTDTGSVESGVRRSAS
jgi:peptidoglycan/xylan/chitin deacetylase (PgdA/CDA1 family)